ncbi:MAG: hypothetical protein NZM00_11840, partial [Anaerolinea sp.]|nr:hypothetical protein [Anaerolinea sp.]
AAAGLIALHEMSTRLAEDHLHARMLAEGLARLPHVSIDLEMVRTNILYFRLLPGAPLDAQTLSGRLKAEYNILMRPYSLAERSFRLVTHYWIRREHIAVVLDALRTLLDGHSAQAAD